MITPVQMLMYGKEASNRKQEIDRQHYTIPNQRPKPANKFQDVNINFFMNFSQKWEQLNKAAFFLDSQPDIAYVIKNFMPAVRDCLNTL